MKKFKWLIFLLVFCLFPLSVAGASLHAASAASQGYEVSEQEGVITSISGNLGDKKVTSFETGFEFLNAFKDDFKIDDAKNSFASVETFENGSGVVYKFNQLIGGVSVYGANLMITTNQSGKVMLVNGKFYVDAQVDDRVDYTADEALNNVNKTPGYSSARFEKQVIYKDNVSFYNTYIITAEYGGAVETLFVSARTGGIIKRLSGDFGLREDVPSNYRDYTIEPVTTKQISYRGQSVSLNLDKWTDRAGNSFYLLADRSRGIYVVDAGHTSLESGLEYMFVDSADGTFSDPIAVQAYEYIMRCYDFYADSANFGTSISGLVNRRNNPVELLVVVHYDVDYMNAAYYIPDPFNSKTAYFLFGDGHAFDENGIPRDDDEFNVDSFVQALDVVGHEYQHNITDSTAMLESMNAPGALAEAISDMFGAVIEGKGIDSDDFWIMGEDIYTDGTAGFRNIAKPSNGCVSNYDDLLPFCTNNNHSHEDCDDGYVHYNCTLVTHAAYLMYQRDTSFFTEKNILALWYNTLLNINSDCSFIEFANTMVNVAENVLHWPMQKVDDVRASYGAVGMPGYEEYDDYITGSGTIADPYVIKSASMLLKARDAINADEENFASAYFSLSNDIDLGGEIFTPIGTIETPFNGVFNGGGNKIFNFTAGVNDGLSGLFGIIGQRGYVRDLVIDATISSNSTYAGAIVGRLEGTIAGVAAYGSVSGQTVGGIAGLVVNDGGTKIESSFVHMTLSGNVVGGLVGKFLTYFDAAQQLFVPGKITSCFAETDITASIGGGLIGQGNAYILTNCYAVTKFSGQADAVFGGLVGSSMFTSGSDYSPEGNYSKNYIMSCWSVAEADPEKIAIFGTIIGKNDEDISKGQIYLEKITVKKVGSAEFIGSGDGAVNIKKVKLKTSTDELFEGNFNFDSPAFYNNDIMFNQLFATDSFNLVASFNADGRDYPTLADSDFWINQDGVSMNPLVAFKGRGTKESPYQISSAVELASLSAMLTPSARYRSIVSGAHFILTDDIDLAGFIFTGIGTAEVRHTPLGESTTYYPFSGYFDGNGHTIYNMTSVGAYSIGQVSLDGLSWVETSYLPGLFSILDGGSGGGVVKNLTLQNANVFGTKCGAVAAVAVVGATLENVTVMGGKVNASKVGGGLIGSVEKVSTSGTNTDVTIDNCYVNTMIGAQIAGGAIGYATNPADGGVIGNINITNFIMRGRISVYGLEDDYDSSATGDFDTDFYANYRPYDRAIGGGVIGVLLRKNTKLTNVIVLADIISYSKNGYIAGFIGTLGKKERATSGVMDIDFVAAKFGGKCYCIFDEVVSSGAGLIGGAYLELGATVSVDADSKTIIPEGMQAILNNGLGGSLNLSSSLKTSSSTLGNGDFAIYSKNYFLDTNNFVVPMVDNSARMFYTVVFRGADGDLYSTLVKEGESINPEDVIETQPTKRSDAQFDYTFVGYDQDTQNIYKSMVVNAVFAKDLRNYTLKYYDRKGNVVGTRQVDYGEEIPQDVEAPTNSSNAFMNYKFVRWGEEGQTVNGAMNVYGVYTKSLTTLSVVLIIVAVVAVLVGATLVFYFKYRNA